MSTYRKIHGRSIQAVTTDPSESVAEGQVWYNTTSDTFKSVLVTEAWASTSPLIQSRDSAGGAGTQTAAMIFGGRNEVDGGPTGGPNAQYNLTEEYNGSGYSAGGALVQGRQAMAGAGTQTAGLGVGGYHPPSPGPKSLVEEYDGSSWSEVTNQPTATFGQGSAGTQTSAVVFGGRGGPGSTWTNATYEYDGTNWTSGGAMGTARVLKGAATGTQTAALAVGGDLTPPGGATNKVEEYDGTSFSEVNAAPANIQVNMVSGIQTSALSFGGNISPYTTQTFKYDGTNFTASAAMGSSASGQNTLKTAPDNSTGLSMGGYGTSSYINTSQEFTTSINVITAGAWASGGNLNTARYSLQGFGATHDAAVAFTGRDTPIYNATEEYNGSTWTSVNNYPQSVNDAAGCGVLTAGLGLGGLYPPNLSTFPTTGRVTAEYDGTNWTSGGSYTYNAWGAGMAGTQTAAIASGGHNYPMPPGNRNDSAEYDGSSWTAGNNMSQVRGIFAAGGSQTASFACGGRSSPGVEDPTNACEEYDGTNWTSGGNYIVAVKENSAGGGPQTAGYVAGGAAPSATAICGFYDGTAWSTAPNLPGAQQLNASTTNNTSNSGAMSFGGGTDKDATYEFTAETTSVNVKTLTQS